MIFKTDYKLENYILNTTWQDLPHDVQERLKGCFIDLMSAAIMDYYNYAHSSGTFGSVGVAAGVGRIFGFSKEQLNNALSVAEFNAPLVPGIRSVEYPSMNKRRKLLYIKRM